MRRLTTGEISWLREMLQTEHNSTAKAKAGNMAIQDGQVSAIANSNEEQSRNVIEHQDLKL